MKLDRTEETSCISLHGYALRGLPPVCQRFHAHGTRISAIVGMSSDGVEAYELSVCSTDSDKFIDFIRGPTMQPFPDKHSILNHACRLSETIAY